MYVYCLYAHKNKVRRKIKPTHTYIIRILKDYYYYYVSQNCISGHYEAGKFVQFHSQIVENWLLVFSTRIQYLTNKMK